MTDHIPLPDYPIIGGGFAMFRPRRACDDMPTLLVTDRPLFPDPKAGMPPEEHGYPLGRSGERSVYQNGQGWQVAIKGVHIGTRATIEEAVALRDDWLTKHGKGPVAAAPSVSPPQPQPTSHRHIFWFQRAWMVDVDGAHLGRFGALADALRVRDRYLVGRTMSSGEAA